MQRVQYIQHHCIQVRISVGGHPAGIRLLLLSVRMPSAYKDLDLFHILMPPLEIMISSPAPTVLSMQFLSVVSHFLRTFGRVSRLLFQACQKTVFGTNTPAAVAGSMVENNKIRESREMEDTEMPTTNKNRICHRPMNRGAQLLSNENVDWHRGKG